MRIVAIVRQMIDSSSTTKTRPFTGSDMTFPSAEIFQCHHNPSGKWQSHYGTHAAVLSHVEFVADPERNCSNRRTRTATTNNAAPVDQANSDPLWFREASTGVLSTSQESSSEALTAGDPPAKFAKKSASRSRRCSRHA